MRHRLPALLVLAPIVLALSLVVGPHLQASTTYGFEFRGTSGYVTTGANDTYVLGETTNQTRNGITFRWSADGEGGIYTAPAHADVLNSIDVRLAGLNYGSAGTLQNFIVTLPATGDYDVRLAIGHAARGATLLAQKVVLKDNGTTRLTVGPTDVADQSFMDAAGVVYTRANWPGSNSAITLTFTSTVFTLELTSATDTPCLAYLSLTQTGGGGAAPGLLLRGIGL